MKIILALYAAYLLNNFVCFPELRVYSNREHMKHSLKGLLEGGRIKTHSWDNTVESYLVSHPGCCTEGRQLDFPQPLLDHLVIIDYEMSDLEKQGGGYANDTHELWIGYIDACGIVMDMTGESYTPEK